MMNATVTYDEAAAEEDFSYYVETTVDPGRALNGTVAAVCILLLVCLLPKLVSRSNEQQHQRRRLLRNENNAAETTATTLTTKDKVGTNNDDVRCPQIPDTDADDSDESYHRKLGAERMEDNNNNNNNNAIHIDNDEEIEISNKKKDSNNDDDDDVVEKDHKTGPPPSQVRLEPSGSLLTTGRRQQLQNLDITIKGGTQSSLVQITRASSNLSNASTRATSIVDGILSARSASRVGRLLKSPSSVSMPDNPDDDTEEKKQHVDKVNDPPTIIPNTDNDNDDDKKKTEDVPDSKNANKSTMEVADGNDDNNDNDNDDDDDDMSELSAYFDLSFLVLGFHRLVELAHWDGEMKALWNLSRPFATQAFIEGFFDLLCVGIIGHVFGAKEANAYVVVMILNKLTNFVNYGFYEGKFFRWPENPRELMMMILDWL